MELLENATENITCADGRKGLRNSSGVILCYNETGPGNRVEYMCDSGYDLISAEILVLTCQVNGVWDHQPAIICQTQGEAYVNDPLPYSQYTCMRASFPGLREGMTLGTGLRTTLLPCINIVMQHECMCWVLA